MGTHTRTLTAPEFEKLPEGSACQLISGELIVTPSPSYEHQDIVLEIASRLRSFVKSLNLGNVVAGPMDVYLGESDVYQPDVVYISNNRQEIIQEKIKGAPDLVVEVLSPSNADFDLGHKRDLYDRSGVQEYWIVDPASRGVEVYVNHESRFVLFSKAQIAGAIRSALLPEF